MTQRYAELAFTEAVRAEQERHGSRAAYAARFADADDAFGEGATADRLGPREIAFAESRDSFYLASLGATGWPYIQHRGGKPGFLRALDDRTLGFADLRGNRQYVTLGNIAGEGRVSLFLMDYAARARLKIFGRARAVPAGEDPALLAALAPPGNVRAERAILIRVEAFDWNCPQHITPRFAEDEVREAVAPLRARIAELEAALAAARGG